MGIFKQIYGKELITVSVSEWKQLLSSNAKLFKGCKSFSRVIGPTVKDSSIVGDVMSMETSYFSSMASEDQMEFYLSELDVYEKNRVGAVNEYVLTIIGAIKIWKEDMVVLKEIERLLNVEYRQLEEESLFLEKGIKVAGKIPSVFQKHLPELSKHLSGSDKDLKSTLEIIKRVEKEVHDEDVFLSKYLKEKMVTMPFLFE